MSWLSSIFHPPTPPDPAKTAAAQSQLNKDTAITQYGLNATNQVTPYGNLSYTQNGTWPDGTPKFTATQSLSPGQQSLYDKDLSTQNKMADAAGSQIDKLGDTLGTPWDPNTDVAKKLVGMQHEFLDPEWNTREEQMRSRLANQGITSGSDAYNTENRQFDDSRSRAYDQMYLDSYKTGLDQSLAERNQPFNEFASFRNGTQIQNPSFTNTPQTNLSTPDLAGMTYQNYQGQVANQNAAMGGVFGLGGAALGGWAKGGFPMPKFG
jgi:hypothetical protein